MPSAAMVTMGEIKSSAMDRLSPLRCSRSASSSVRGMSPTTARESIPAAAATAVASTMPTSEPGTRAPHFLGHTSMTAATSSPISTEERSG